MDYVISTAMSLTGTMAFILLAWLLSRGFLLKSKSKHVRKFDLVWLCVAAFVVVFAMIQPSNTYKNNVQRMPNPVINQTVPKIKEHPPTLVHPTQEERKKHFDELISRK